MDAFLQDLRYGARMLARHKGVTAVAVLSLAIGIAANTAIFSVVNSVLLRPRPVSKPAELVAIYSGTPQQPYHTTSHPSYRDLRARAGPLADLTAYGIQQFRLGEGDDLEEAWGEAVADNYFSLLGVVMHRGRGFLAEEDSVIGRNPVVVISHRVWQRRFSGAPDVAGRTLFVNGQQMTVIGVTPPEFYGMMGGLASDVWVPTTMMPSLDRSRGERIVTSRGNKWLFLVGRLKPGATVEQAQAHADAFVAGMRIAEPREWTRDDGRPLAMRVLPEKAVRLPPALRVPAYAGVALLFVAVNLVLIVACINLASLLVARAVARRGEIGVRLALGAGRWRIVRQMLTESVLLAVIAGTIGVVLAVWALGALVAAMGPLPEGIRVAFNPSIDWRVVAYAVAFTTVTGVVFGLAPALHASRTELATVLKDAGAGARARRSSRGRALMVVAQVSLSLLLLIGAGLVLRSLGKVRPTNLGFASENVVYAPLNLDEATYDRRAAHQFYEQIAARAAALPGVTAVSLVEGIPGGFMSRSRRGTAIEGYVPAADERLEIDAAIVGPRYFTNVGMPIVEGRDIDAGDRDGAPCVVMVNEAFVRRYFPGAESALGRRMQGSYGPGDAPPQMCAIVGVFRDEAWQSLNEEVRPFFALPLFQTYRERMTLLVHTSGSPDGLVPAVREAIRGLDRWMPVSGVRTLRDLFGAVSFPFRALGFVLVGCGLLALILATVGVYGIVAYSVAQRRQEVGLRMALGAMPQDILRMVVADGMRLVVGGAVVGVLLGLALTRVLSSGAFGTGLLFGVNATDAFTFVAVTLALVAVGLLACVLPARRASRFDPMAALRNG